MIAHRVLGFGYEGNASFLNGILTEGVEGRLCEVIPFCNRAIIKHITAHALQIYNILQEERGEVTLKLVTKASLSVVGGYCSFCVILTRIDTQTANCK